jgi:hypothetical protein
MFFVFYQKPLSKNPNNAKMCDLGENNGFSTQTHVNYNFYDDFNINIILMVSYINELLQIRPKND